MTDDKKRKRKGDPELVREAYMSSPSSEEENKCYFCPNTETLYCKLCKKWMCDDCRKSYPSRMKAMLKEKLF